MPDLGEAGVIQVWQPRVHNWVEFRGPPYSKWRPGERSDMQAVHDALEGWHATVLHQGEALLIHENHPDFERVWSMFQEAARDG